MVAGASNTAPFAGEVIVATGTGAAASTANDRDAWLAALKFALPGWFARTVHVPALSSFADADSTVQIDVVAEVKLMASPEDTVAFSATGEKFSAVSGIASKTIVCAALLTTTF